MFELTLTPRFSETDALGHVNNTVIPVWFEEARTPYFRFFTPDLEIKKWKLILAKTELEFLREIFYGDDVTVESSIEKIGNSSFIVRQELSQNGEMCASGRATLVNYDYNQGKSVSISEDIRERLSQHIK